MSNMNEKIDLPQRIKKKFSDIIAECKEIDSEIDKIRLKPTFTRTLIHVQGPLLEKEHKAIIISFVNKLAFLPKFKKSNIVEIKGEYYLQNLSSGVQLINDFRPLLSNQNDSIYFTKIHKYFNKALHSNDKKHELVIDVFDENKNDVTKEYMELCDSNIKAIKLLISKLDLNYLYNGYLHHQDTCFLDRFIEDWTSGEMNYILYKNALLLNGMGKDLFFAHIQLAESLNTVWNIGSL